MPAYSRGEHFTRFSVDIPPDRRKFFTRDKYHIYLGSYQPSAKVGKAEISEDKSLLHLFLPSDIHINMVQGMSVCCAPLDGEVMYLLVGPPRLMLANIIAGNGHWEGVCQN